MSDREAGPIPRREIDYWIRRADEMIARSSGRPDNPDTTAFRGEAIRDIFGYALALQEVVGNLTADCSDGMEDPECFFCGADYAGNVMDYDYKHLKWCAFARGKALLPEEENDE